MPRACLSLLGLEEAARAAAQGSLAKRKVEALKSFRMVGHGLLSGAGQGKGLQIMGTAHQNPRGKCGFLSRGVERREGGQQGSLEGQGQGRAWPLSSVGGEPQQASILCPALPPGSGPD